MQFRHSRLNKELQFVSVTRNWLVIFAAIIPCSWCAAGLLSLPVNAELKQSRIQDDDAYVSEALPIDQHMITLSTI